MHLLTHTSGLVNCRAGKVYNSKIQVGNVFRTHNSKYVVMKHKETLLASRPEVDEMEISLAQSKQYQSTG